MAAASPLQPMSAHSNMAPATKSASTGPSVIVFDTKQDNGLSSLPKPVYKSWEHGPAKMQTYVRRGRPPKNGGDKTRSATSGKSGKSAHTHAPGAQFKFVASFKHDERLKDQGERDAKADPSHKFHAHRQSDQKEKQLARRRRTDAHPVAWSRPLSSTARSPPTRIPQRIGPPDPFSSLPFRMSGDSYKLLNQYISRVAPSVYALEHNLGTDPACSFWLPMAIHDSALLHAFLGCAEAFTSTQHQLKERPSAVMHLRQAIRILNQRLGGGGGGGGGGEDGAEMRGQGYSDETIVSVATIAVMEKISGYQNHWAIHMTGLRHMVNLRGGLEALRVKPLVYLKICRADLTGSVDAIQRPFFAPEILNAPSLSPSSTTPPSLVTATPPPLQIQSKGFRALIHLIPLPPQLQSLISTVEAITLTLSSLLPPSPPPNPLSSNSPSPSTITTPIPPSSLRETIIKTEYQLLCLELPSPHPNPNATPNITPPLTPTLNHLLRLSLLLHLLTLSLDLPRPAKACNNLIMQIRGFLADLALQQQRQRRRRVWEDGDGDGDGDREGEEEEEEEREKVIEGFRIWIMFLIGVMANTEEERSWFERRWRGVVACGGGGCEGLDEGCGFGDVGAGRGRGRADALDGDDDGADVDAWGRDVETGEEEAQGQGRSQGHGQRQHQKQERERERRQKRKPLREVLLEWLWVEGVHGEKFREIMLGL